MDLIFWIAFLAFIGVFLALDLGVFHKKAHVVAPTEAAAWTVGLGDAGDRRSASACCGGRAPRPASSGSRATSSSTRCRVDNVFVFALIFGAFAVPRELQHRVLFWGVVGALVMRFALILAGASLIESYHWIIYVFGAFLVFTGIRMRGPVAHANRTRSRTRSCASRKRHLRVVPDYHDQKFFVRNGGRAAAATPLLLALITVETSDLIFAVDSIPAIFAVTTDPFVVFTSNAFAILGLRSLYFLLADAADRFRYLKVGLAAVLIFVGGKMLLTDILKVPPVLVAAGHHRPSWPPPSVASLLADRRDARSAVPG